MGISHSRAYASPRVRSRLATPRSSWRAESRLSGGITARLMRAVLSRPQRNGVVVMRIGPQSAGGGATGPSETPREADDRLARQRRCEAVHLARPSCQHTMVCVVLR